MPTGRSVRLNTLRALAFNLRRPEAVDCLDILLSYRSPIACDSAVAIPTDLLDATDPLTYYMLHTDDRERAPALAQS